MKFSIILAVDEKNWIWKNNTLPWSIPWDMKYFKDITTQTQDLWKLNAVIMWRKTWLSIPRKYRPLDNRVNCVLTRKIINSDVKHQLDDFVLYYSSFEQCLFELSFRENIENVFVIWWANLYNQVLNHPMLDKIYLTKIKWDFDCDVFFEWVPKEFIAESYTDPIEENGNEYSFWVYKNKSN